MAKEGPSSRRTCCSPAPSSIRSTTASRRWSCLIADVFELESDEPFKGNLDLARAAGARSTRDAAAIAYVCIEVSDNAAGGVPVSLRASAAGEGAAAPRTRSRSSSTPRASSRTRCFVIEHEQEHARQASSGQSSARSCRSADAVVASLAKDFCVNKGGMIATNDEALLAGSQDAASSTMAAAWTSSTRSASRLSLQNRRHIETQVRRRMERCVASGRRLDERGSAGRAARRRPLRAHRRRSGSRSSAKLEIRSRRSWPGSISNTGIRARRAQRRHAEGHRAQRAGSPGRSRRAEERTSRRDRRRLGCCVRRRSEHPGSRRRTTRRESVGDVHAAVHAGSHIDVAATARPRRRAAQAPAEPVGAPVCASRGAGASPPASRLSEPAARPLVAAGPQPARSDIAIVGMAGRYPKAEERSRALGEPRHGRDCIERHSGRRATSAACSNGAHAQVPRRLHRRRRPVRLAVLQHLAARSRRCSIRRSGCSSRWPGKRSRTPATTRRSWRGSDASRNIGVFVGAVWAMYQMLGVEEQRPATTSIPNSFLWSIANRVSYWMNLSGPSLTVDTACSSSLTALHLACEAIQRGECSAAIVGGVNLDLHQRKFDINRAGGALSSDGVCRSVRQGRQRLRGRARASARCCSSRWTRRCGTATTSTA